MYPTKALIEVYAIILLNPNMNGQFSSSFDDNNSDVGNMADFQAGMDWATHAAGSSEQDNQAMVQELLGAIPAGFDLQALPGAAAEQLDPAANIAALLASDSEPEDDLNMLLQAELAVETEN